MNPVLVPANITSPQDMLIILVVALIVFGPKKLPEIGRQIGSAIREFNKIRTDAMSAFQLDELNHYDSTPSYHTPPYGTTYPANNDPFPAVDSYHSGATETVYHDDPVHTTPALESATAGNGVTENEPAALPEATAKVATAPPGPAALRELIATHAAESAPATQPTLSAHDVTTTHSVEAEPLSVEKTIQ